MDYYFSIKYSFSHFMELKYAEFPNVDEIQGEIFFNDYENEPIKVGSVELHYYNYAFVDSGFNFYDSFDRSMNTIKLGHAILNYGTSNLKSEIEDQIGLSFNSNILVIHKIMLYHNYRRKGFGKEILTGIETFFNGRCGYIALQSFPMQHDLCIEKKEFEEFNLSKLNNHYKHSQLSLDLFYQNCGFYKIEGKDSFFIKNIDPI